MYLSTEIIFANKCDKLAVNSPPSYKMHKAPLVTRPVPIPTPHPPQKQTVNEYVHTFCLPVFGAAVLGLTQPVNYKFLAQECESQFYEHVSGTLREK